MIILSDWMHDASMLLCKISTNADQELRWIVEHFLQKPHSFFVARPEFLLNDQQLKNLSAALNRRLSGEPLGYVLGEVPFLDVTIEVFPPSLIPRPETEEWVAELIEILSKYNDKPIKIADLCTGTGCIAVALGLTFNNAEIIAVDIQKEAIVLAKKNVKHAGLFNVQVRQGDFLDALEMHSFDLIVTNPPYISQQEWQGLDTSVKGWEDPLALTDGQDGLWFYRRLAASAHHYLKKELFAPSLPRIVSEIGYQQGDLVRNLFLHSGWKNVLVKKDLSGKDRWILVS